MAEFGDVQAILEASGEIARAAIQERDGVFIAVHPEGWVARVIDEEIEKRSTNPDRKSGLLTVTDKASFVEYANRQKSAATIVTVDPNGNFKAILNHHEPEAQDHSQPGWGDHVCALVRRFAPAWSAWQGIAGKWVTQSQLAEFLEERRRDIYEPEAATIIELAEFFEAAKEEHVTSHRRLANGTVQFEYTNAVASTRGRQGEIEVPTAFRIGIPIFRNDGEDELVQVEVRMRWRIQNSQPVFLFVLPEAVTDAFDARIELDIASVIDDTGLPVLRVA